MKSDMLRGRYDPLTALNNAGSLMGMELTQSGRQLIGGYYINGERHAYRRDKLKVFIWRGGVWVQEEGGQCLSLESWLVQYGHCADYREALRVINGQPQSIVWSHELRERGRQDVQYVSGDVLRGAKAYDVHGCALFRWMSGLFGEEKVRKVWDEYNVTTDSHGNAVFWYTDQSGRVLFDKRIAYMENGHRDRNYFPPRKYRVGDGFSGRCYFGANTVGDSGKVYVTESEKSCLLVALYYGRQCVATGGKGGLKDVDGRMVLLPDMDAREEWAAKGDIWPWWERWGIALDEIPDHADIGDMIEWKICKANG